MRKIAVIFLALILVVSFTAAQPVGGTDERQSGQDSATSGSGSQSTDDGSIKADSGTSNAPDSAQQKAEQGKQNKKQGPPEGKKPSLPAQASATASKVVNTVFGTIGNIGQALFGIFGGGGGK